MHQLENLFQSTDSIALVSGKVAMATEQQLLYGGDISIMAKMLQGFAHFLQQDLNQMPLQEDKEVLVTEVMQNILKMASNLLSDLQKLALDDLVASKQAVVETSIIMGIENVLLLAETINKEKNLIEVTNNLLSAMCLMRSCDVMDQLFPGLIHKTEEAEVVVPAQGLIENSVNSTVRLVFFLFLTRPGLSTARWSVPW